MRRVLLALLGLAVALLVWWRWDESTPHVSRARNAAPAPRETAPTRPGGARHAETTQAESSGDEFPGSIRLVGARDEPLVVLAVDPGGNPVRDARIVLVDRKAGTDLAEGVTGEDGKFWYERPPARRIRVDYLPGDGFPRHQIGVWNPRNPRLVRFEVYPVRDLTMQVTVDDEPRIPDDLRLTGGLFLEEIRDASTGWIRARFLPSDRHTDIGAHAPGMIPGTATLDYLAGQRTMSCDLRLYTERRLIVRALGKPAHLNPLVIERRRKRGDYGSRIIRSVALEEADDRLTTTYIVPAGHYRVLTPGRLVIREFEVEGEQTTLDLDLRAAGYVEVRVQAPAPFDEPANALWASLESEDGVVRGYVASGKRFLHPGDRPVTVRAVGRQVLRPHPKLGAVTVLQPGGVAHVHLIEAPRVRFGWRLPTAAAPPIRDVPGARFGRQDSTALSDDQPAANISVGLYLERGKHVWALASGSGSAWNYTFPSLCDGRFDLVIRDGNRGIALLRNVELDGATDLGLLQPKGAHHVTIVARNLPRQTSLRVGVRVPDSEVELCGALIAEEQTATILHALPAGRWNLTFQSGQHVWTKSIECADGKAQVVEVDCANR